MKTQTKILLTGLAITGGYVTYRILSNRMVSSKGLDFLKVLEGSKSKMYKDVKGLPTIGVGHLITSKEPSLLTATLSGAQINKLLNKDLDRFEKAVKDTIKVPLKQNQKDALVSLAFNIGENGFKNSTLAKRINSGASKDSIIQGFSMWDSPIVLSSRRAKEARLFFTGNYSNALPSSDLKTYYKPTLGLSDCFNVDTKIIRLENGLCYKVAC